MGAKAYRMIEHWHWQPGDAVVEVGSDRGDGSTSFLSAFCADRQLDFFSIDIDPVNEPMILDNGEAWLRRFDGVIGFAYLDNFDYVFDSIAGMKFVARQIERYAELGLEMTNEASERAHLAQSMEVLRCSRPGTQVLFDDTWLEDDGWHGKGARAVPFLLSNGFGLVNTDGREYNGFALLGRP